MGGRANEREAGVTAANGVEDSDKDDDEPGAGKKESFSDIDRSKFGGVNGGTIVEPVSGSGKWSALEISSALR